MVLGFIIYWTVTPTAHPSTFPGHIIGAVSSFLHGGFLKRRVPPNHQIQWFHQTIHIFPFLAPRLVEVAELQPTLGVLTETTEAGSVNPPGANPAQASRKRLIISKDRDIFSYLCTRVSHIIIYIYICNYVYIYIYPEVKWPKAMCVYPKLNPNHES